MWAKINVQGQTIPNVRIYLPRHVFSHGQLYVALSKGVSQNSTKVLIKEGKIEGEDWDFTKNVVFKDILWVNSALSPCNIWRFWFYSM